MSLAVQPHKCSRPECKVSETGVCVEGHTPLESCHFFGLPTDDVSEKYEEEDNEETTDVLQSHEPVRVSLPSGESLTPAEIDQFLLWKPARFITIIGELSSGKTTLICSLYNSFLRGSFADYLFAGSHTLVGFEKTSHHSRIDSGRIAPDTLRTSFLDGLKYFHISLVSNGESKARVELMLSDRAGEQYQKALNNSDVVSELIEVKKAQHVVLLLDGGRIADPFLRTGAMQAVRQTLRAFLDGGALSATSRVQVVTTKIDLLANIPGKEALDNQLELFRNALQNDFGERLGELSFWKIAARDPSGDFYLAYGMKELLTTWCAPVPIAVKREPLQIALNTEFDRLLSRTPRGEIS